MSHQERNGPPDSDDALAHAWKSASDEQPPTSLDAAIIAAARTAVGQRVESTTVVAGKFDGRQKRARWQPLAAAAAVAGLAFALVQSLPRAPDRATSASVAPPLDAQGTETAAPAAAAKDSVATQARTERTVGPTAAERTAAPAEVPAPPAAIASSPTSNVTGKLRAADSAQRASAATPIAATAEQGAALPSGVADRIARIKALYEAGDVAGATEALRSLRADTPQADQYLPESLHRWASTID
jgi:hypothetical protein